MHRNARLTPMGRMTLCLRIESGRPIAHVAAEMGISRATASKWWQRWRSGGPEALVDRCSRPHTSPKCTPADVEAQIVELRHTLKLGPARIGYRLGVAASTVHRVLCRLGLNRLSWMDRPTGTVIRRYERDTPGELVHLDVKKLGRIPDGGGWRTHGRANTPRQRVGYAFIHSAVDDHSRLAYSEILTAEDQHTATAFWQRARAWYAERGITITEILTDNGNGYRSNQFAAAVGDVKHRRTRPYRPQTNGKVERFNRTLLDEWAYVRPYTSEAERSAALAEWLHTYNHHRSHTALAGHTPIERVNNVPDQYT